MVTDHNRSAVELVSKGPIIDDKCILGPAPSYKIA